MSGLYPRYRVTALILSLAFAIPWAVVYALRGDYGMAIVLPGCVAVILSILANIPAARKYDRLLLRTYSEQCDGETFARDHARLDPNKCAAVAQQAVVLSNSAIAAYERGDDKGAFLLAEEAVTRVDGKKGIPPVTLGAVYLNCGAYAAEAGRLGRAEEMLDRIRALRGSLKPSQPIKWLEVLEDCERRLAFDIRFRGGDYGNEVLSYFRDRAERSEQKCARVSYRYELGCLCLYRGEREEAMRAFEAVIADGNTLRVVREARGRLEGLEIDAPRREERNEVIS